MNYDPNNDRQNEREQNPNSGAQSGGYDYSFGPNGQNPNQGWQYGNQYNPNGYPPNNGYGFYPPIQNQPDNAAKNAQTFGIVALIGLFFCQLLSIIFGAMAMSNAKKSAIALGHECSEARTGRICGLVGLILGIGSIVLAVFGYILFFIVFALTL